MIFSGVGFVRPGLGSLLYRMVSRRHYITAYRKALQGELKNAASIFKSSPTAVKLEIERCLYKELNELHKKLSAAEILVFRDFVLTVLQRQGENVSSLKGAVIACSVKCVQYCNFRVKLSSRVDSENEYETDSENENENENEDESYYLATVDAPTPQSKSTSHPPSGGVGLGVIKKEIHVTDKSDSGVSKESNSGYISSKELNSVHSNGNLSMNVSLSVSRLAVTVLEEEVETEVQVESTHGDENENEELLHHQQRRRSSGRSQSLSMSRSYREVGGQAGENVRNIFSFVLYDTEVNVRSVRDHEKSMSVRIRSVRAYGMRGTEIIVWGGDPNDLVPADREEVTQGKSDGEIDTKTIISAVYLSLKLVAYDYDSSTNPTNGENVTATATATAAAKKSPQLLPTKNKVATNITTNTSDGICNTKNNDRRGKLNVGVVMSSLTATWDSESLHRLKLLGDRLVYKHPTSSPLELLAVTGVHPYAALRLKASQLSMSKIGGASSGDQGYRYILDYGVLYCMVLWCTVLHCIMVYCAVLYYDVLYCTVL